MIAERDYIKSNWGSKETWRGKVRRVHGSMALIEWSYCGGLPTDICTWVFTEEIKRIRKGRK